MTTVSHFDLAVKRFGCSAQSLPQSEMDTKATRIRQVFEAWVQRIGSSSEPVDADPDLASYICGVLEDVDESTFDVLCEVCCGLPCFAKLNEAAKTQAVLSLLQDVRERADQQAPVASCTLASSLDAVRTALKQATIQCQQQQQQQMHEACADITNLSQLHAARPSAGKHPDQHPDQEGLGVLRLLELCPPGVTREFARHLVQQKSGDVQAAADMLLDCSDVLQQQEQWQQQLQQQQAEAQAAEREKQLTKKQLVERFDLQAVSCGSGRKSSQQDIMPFQNKGQQESKVRYREGRVVSSRGEKFIIEQQGEEWDGGSKGKVYTKGKRGKGFV